jgi:polyisoprenoid-binding protein YceI
LARFEIDEKETSVFIDARSSLHPIHSESHSLRGFFEGALTAAGDLDPAVETRAVLELPIDALSSGNPVYDREMRRRVDARRHPQIDAVLTGIESAGSDGLYKAEGDVTFRGVTRRVSDELRLSSPAPGTIVFEGEHVFNLPEFGMDPPRILILRVYPDVRVRVRIVARETSPKT